MLQKKLIVAQAVFKIAYKEEQRPVKVLNGRMLKYYQALHDQKRALVFGPGF